MTKTPPALNLVHESETQRQHVRVKIPGVLELEAGKGRAQFRLVDLSAGGIGFEAKNVAFQPGQVCTGRIHLTIEPIALAIPVRFTVCHYDASSGRAGGRFEDLAPAEISTIRRVVTAYLSGELVGVGDVMHTLSRNNFTQPRGDGARVKERRGFFASLRAGVVSLVMIAVGVVALIYAGQRLNEKMFGAHAVAARVSGPTYRVTMPRDGYFRSLVPEDGIVEKGAPIGTFETSMFDLIRSQALDAQLKPEELEALLDKSIKGTVTSPCDCRVQAAYTAPEQFVGKGQPLVGLEPVEFEPYIVARFTYPTAERLALGTPVSLRVSGDVQQRRGHISQIRRPGGESLSEDLVVIVTPDEPLEQTLISRPVQVTATGRGAPDFSRFVNTAQARIDERFAPAESAEAADSN